MRYSDIASFLNIPEKIAGLLGEKRLLPGGPSVKGWEATREELESWYMQFTGKEWARLVSDGQIDPLIVQVHLGVHTTKARLLDTLRSWERQGRARIISERCKRGTDSAIVLTLKTSETVRHGLKSLRRTRLPRSVHNPIKSALQCEGIIEKNPVFVIVSKGEILRMGFERALGELPQYQREIIKFYLAKRALQLSHEFQ